MKILIAHILLLLIANQGWAQKADVVINAAGTSAVKGENTDQGNNLSMGVYGEGYSGIRGTSSAASGVGLRASGGVYGLASGSNAYSGYFLGGKGVYMSHLTINTLNVDINKPILVGSTSGNGNGAHVTGGGTWTNGSSRTFKNQFKSVDHREVLDQLCTLRIWKWRYKNNDEGDHLGPVAEDFSGIFHLGNDDRYIATVDVDGVHLTALKALNEKLEGQEQILNDLMSRTNQLSNLMLEK